MRQGSLQRGGSILKKGVVVDRRTFTRAKNDCSLFLLDGGRYNRLLGNLGREDTCKDGSLEVLVPSRSLLYLV